jgi:hypothetical protein
MRRICLLVAVAACYRSSAVTEPANLPPPASRPAKPVEPRPLEIDWPGMIGMPEEEGLQRIAASLGIEDDPHFQTRGIDVSTGGGQIASIIIHVRDERGQFSWPPYRGPLFAGLTPNMTRDQVIERLGPPTEKKVGNNWNWIQYVRATITMQFQFSFRDDRLETITLDAP